MLFLRRDYNRQKFSRASNIQLLTSSGRLFTPVATLRSEIGHNDKYVLVMVLIGAAEEEMLLSQL